MYDTISDWILKAGANPAWAKALTSAAVMILTVAAGYLVSFSVSFAACRLVAARGAPGAGRDKFDSLVRAVRWFVFSWFLYAYFPAALRPFKSLASASERILEMVAVISGAMALSAAITFLRSVAKRRRGGEAFASKTFSQMLKILIWFTAAIIAASSLMGKSPAFVLSGLGALTAVLMLIFRDSLLGLVAGVQVSQNDMVRIGDWITMPKFNADGNVIDIALTTVKVQNFDNTVTMIPSSALISDSFINWRYMSVSKGRRIKRPVWISATSVSELTEEEIKSLVGRSLLESGDRPISNLAAFELWLRRMLAANSDISDELTCMVRQTEFGDTGIPVEVYAFTKTRDWVEYERVQTEIFDRIFVTVPKFGLRIYQRTGDNSRI